MTSVQSFLRQRVTGSTILAGPTPTGTDVYFTFVAGSGNYVGNYPPGSMVDATSNVAGLLTAVTGAAVVPLMRDMGKTVKASVVASTFVGTPGFFREVQVLVPSIVASATSSSANGVIGQLPGSLPAPGGNAGDAGYATFYIPIVVSGVVASTAAAVPVALTVSSAGIKIGEQQ
jgi:hypothetical protein